MTTQNGPSRPKQTRHVVGNLQKKLIKMPCFSYGEHVNHIWTALSSLLKSTIGTQMGLSSLCWAPINKDNILLLKKYLYLPNGIYFPISRIPND